MKTSRRTISNCEKCYVSTFMSANIATKRKKKYETLSISMMAIEIEDKLLTGSTIDTANVQSVGQEFGPQYDMSGVSDANTGKSFNHEWDASF